MNNQDWTTIDLKLYTQSRYFPVQTHEKRDSKTVFVTMLEKSSENIKKHDISKCSILK